MRPQVIARWIKPPVFAALSLPALWLAAQWTLFFAGEPHGLGFNPQETSNRFTGIWALRCLLASLALTPLAGLTGRPWPILFRRMIGLFAFAYAVLHLTSYVALDQLFDWQAIAKDIVKRTYITLGMTAFVLLAPLAVTSTAGAVKRLGARRWKRLHRLVYAAGILAVAHYMLLVKGNRLEPLIYAGILAILLGYRVAKRPVRRAGRASRG